MRNAKNKKESKRFSVIGKASLMLLCVFSLMSVVACTEEESVKYPEASSTIVCQDYVDLGLSVKWATCNVGASCPAAFGGFFAWGELNVKSDYSKENSFFYGVEASLILADPNATDISGDVTRDVAAAKSNGKWRIPTAAEMNELIEGCTWEWTSKASSCTCHSVAGYTVTGPNGNSIFLPAAGYQSGTTISNRENFGGYWSASLGKTDNDAIF